MARLLLGLLKGAVLGAGVGYGAHAAGIDGTLLWVAYGVIGALVGLLCGRPLWSHLRDSTSTMWTSVLKALFGAGVAFGLYALGRKFAGGVELTLGGETRALTWSPILGGAIGAIYGAFVEVDDGPAKAGDAAPKKKPSRP